MLPHVPAMMNMMPAVRLILALVVSSMLFMVRQVREKMDITAPSTLSTTPTIIRARTAWKAPGGQEAHTQTSELMLDVHGDIPLCQNSPEAKNGFELFYTEKENCLLKKLFSFKALT